MGFGERAGELSPSVVPEARATLARCARSVAGQTPHPHLLAAITTAFATSSITRAKLTHKQRFIIIWWNSAQPIKSNHSPSASFSNSSRNRLSAPTSNTKPHAAPSNFPPEDNLSSSPSTHLASTKPSRATLPCPGYLATTP